MYKWNLPVHDLWLKSEIVFTEDHDYKCMLWDTGQISAVCATFIYTLSMNGHIKWNDMTLYIHSRIHKCID